MRRLVLAAFAPLLLALLGASHVLAYENPIMDSIKDPDCILLDGIYHLIEPEKGAKGDYFNYRTSKDLIHWSDPVKILQQSNDRALWQGSFYRDADGKLYLYYATFEGDRQKAVRVASAADFTGPFTELATLATGAIDPYPLRDASGTLWLYYKNDLPGFKSIFVQKMIDPATPAATAPKEILRPESGTFEDNGYLTVEGPTVIQRGGLYFLLYTGGPFGSKRYAVGYAVSDNPDGPFTRGPNNPILSITQNPQVFSPGVPTVVTDGAGKSWMVYRQRETAERKSRRVLAIDPLDDSKAAQGILSAYPTRGEEKPDPVPLP